MWPGTVETAVSSYQASTPAQTLAVSGLRVSDMSDLRCLLLARSEARSLGLQEGVWGSWPRHMGLKTI